MAIYPIQQTEGSPAHFQYGAVEGNHYLSGTSDALTNTPGAANYIVGGNWFITGSAIDAVTLALPVSGGGWYGASGATFPTLTGQNGVMLTFVSKTAFAHTITTPANGINGSKHIATFTAAAGNGLTLLADSGVWWVISTIGVTLS